ncbi:aldo/keto reductase [Cohnella nanjingensis]|uniref:Aldo/keto reductase n=1 Tax=Cohnella nanjingensis TaxID=1387779 RepID=A0A7X0VJA6_9BACL|nr:aldo/keto reductase [Cohnella nanjingensis]MBB6675368.1 aldo/keto reductase [Cohnella nanjingensis]
MEKRKFGQTDMNVSVLGFGSAEIGMDTAPITSKEAETLLGDVLDQGVNVIDTASSYKASEGLIGQAISNRRREYYLFSKLGEGESVGLPYPDWDVRNVQPSIERSLKDLKTDYLDLLLIHSCSEAVLRQGDLVEAVRKLKRDGVVRYIGYSGDSTDALYAIRTDVFDALETSVNIADQEALSLTLTEAAKRSMGVIAKRPIANAIWTREGLENAPDPYKERLDKLDYPFMKQESDAIAEKALRFVLSVPYVDTAIVGTTNASHFKDNVRYAAKGKLPDREILEIRNRWLEACEPAWAGLK